jgi:hypothetical protein
MIQNVIRELGGIAIYGIISVCLFFTVFTVAMIWALVQRKAFCQRMQMLPLNDGSKEAKGEITHE